MEEATGNNDQLVVDGTSCNNPSTTVEECGPNDFKKWKEGIDTRHIINNVMLIIKEK